mmetsp:Transcript_90178/g.259873  ORF Transcript_90178/g.259873 Transcript_90178/m.259873 type:complete len:371 (-) Transcript_90178:213-1325(-)
MGEAQTASLGCFRDSTEGFCSCDNLKGGNGREGHGGSRRRRGRACGCTPEAFRERGLEEPHGLADTRGQLLRALNDPAEDFLRHGVDLGEGRRHHRCVDPAHGFRDRARRLAGQVVERFQYRARILFRMDQRHVEGLVCPAEPFHEFLFRRILQVGNRCGQVAQRCGHVLALRREGIQRRRKLLTELLGTHGDQARRSNVACSLDGNGDVVPHGQHAADRGLHRGVEGRQASAHRRLGGASTLDGQVAEARAFVAERAGLLADEEEGLVKRLRREHRGLRRGVVHECLGLGRGIFHDLVRLRGEIFRNRVRLRGGVRRNFLRLLHGLVDRVLGLTRDRTEIGELHRSPLLRCMLGCAVLQESQRSRTGIP